jgi:inositol hexakisphosphate/diphosphoinositol-pentakisphosphate kinase
LQERGKKLDLEKEKEWIAKLMQLKTVLERHSFEGLSRKVQLKPIKWSTETGVPIEILFILKWGGELTHSGVEQAVQLGEHFRQ